LSSSMIGNLNKVTRSDANALVTNGLARGSKTATVDRQISVIRAVFKIAITEREIPKTDPFLSLRIAGLGDDSVSRGTFEIPQLHALYTECRRKDDDIRWIVALQIDLGCRIAEAVGLSLSDFHMH
jgi:site-specific recombinase XerD